VEGEDVRKRNLNLKKKSIKRKEYILSQNCIFLEAAPGSGK